jgi:hypothetical protein
MPENFPDPPFSFLNGEKGPFIGVVSDHDDYLVEQGDGTFNNAFMSNGKRIKGPGENGNALHNGDLF